MVVLYIAGSLHFGFLDHTRDLSLAFREKYVSIEGEVLNLNFTNSTQKVRVANQEFSLKRNTFNDVNRNNIYRIVYLPNSKYVIDVIDEDGSSLLKKR